MNTMKKWLAFGWLVAAGLCGTAWAVTFTLDSTTGTITGYAGFSGGDLMIPATIGDCEVKAIGANAFYNETAMTGVTIPASVTNIGAHAFGYCSSLVGVTFAEDSKLKAIGSSAFFGTALTSVTIPAGVTDIGESAFEFCRDLASVTFAPGNQLENIANAVFKKSGLTSITIPASVTNIGDSVFLTCKSLSQVTFADGSLLKAIDDIAFKGCSSLTEMTIPAGVTTIGSGTFTECSSLTNVTFAPGSQLKKIGQEMFRECPLTSVTLPGGLTDIGPYAFFGCPLTDVTLPEKLTDIGVMAFVACTNLTEITIPAGVTNIGMGAFCMCSKLEEVTVLATEPPQAGELLFSATGGEDPIATLKAIKVPAESVDKYKNPETGSGWSTYATLITDGAEPTSAGTADDPWKVGAVQPEDVLAYTNDNGGLVITGNGSISDNKPWLGDDIKGSITEVDIGPGVTVSADDFTGCGNIEKIVVPHGQGETVKAALGDPLAALVEERPNYLAFTAGESGGMVYLMGTEHCGDPLLETAFDAMGPWTPLVIDDSMSDDIYLTPGQTVYFRRRDPIPVTNLNTADYRWKFEIEGQLEASGNIMSLLDQTCQQTVVGEHAFEGLFSGAETLMSAPELSATTLAESCYQNMFNGCISLTNAPALPAKTLAKWCYSRMFFGCTSLVCVPELSAMSLSPIQCCAEMLAAAENLNAVTVEFKTWNDTTGGTGYWLSEVAEEGVFTCPIELPVIKDASHIPEGWVVKKRFTLPVTMETGSYVVSNLTGEATLLEPIQMSGNDAIYEVTLDMPIGIYLEPAPGYVALGHNPLLLSNMSAGVDLYGMLPWTTLTPDGAGYRPWQWAETAYGYLRIDLLNDNGSHPWPLLDENCCPTGWAAYTNANGEVVFIGEGPLPEGFAEKPPFDDILPSAPKIIVPAGEADRFRTALPDFADKVTTLPTEDPLKALCVGIGSNAGCLSQNIAKNPDMANVLATCHAEIVEAMRARPAVASYLALAGNKVLDALGAFYGEPEEVSAETEALLEIFAETVAVVDLLTAAPSGICVTAAAMLDRYDYRSEEMAQFKRESFSNFVAALPNRPLREVDALGQVGAEMMSSIRNIGNPEQFPLITAAFTDAAEGLSGCLEAQALGTVAAQLMKSIARQPEAAGTLREAFADVVKLSRSVAGRTDVRAQALSKVATQLMDAIARQPEVAGTLREAFFDVVKSFAGRTGVQSLALSKIGGSMMDAIARQPEARGKLRGAFADVAEKIAGLCDVQACALSMVGGSLMDAMARQPEASNAILAACLDAAEAIKGQTDAQAEMLGKIGSSLMDAMARQPEARGQLRGAFADAMAMAGGLPDGEALALGKTGGSLMDATARQPEAAGTLHAAFLDIAAAVDGRTESQALAIGRVGGNQMDAMARVPEKCSAIRDAVTNLVVKAIEQRSDAKALALGETGASLMDAIARCFDAYETLCSAFGTVVAAVDSCISDAQAQALSRTGGGLMDAIARQPTATQNLLQGFAVVKELTVVRPDAEAQMLGEIGKQLMDSIARQPTMADEMVEFFQLAGTEMQGGSEEWVSAIGNAAVKGVDTLARSPESFETLVKMFNVGEDTMGACTPRATPGIGLTLVGLAGAMAGYWQNPNIADELLVQQMNFDLLIRDVCRMVRIVSAKSARPEGAWSGAAQVVYELRWLETEKHYALTFDLKAANQTGSCTTNLPPAVVDGVYTQEIYRTELFGPESQVQDPAAELTLKLIEKSKYGK